MRVLFAAMCMAAMATSAWAETAATPAAPVAAPVAPAAPAYVSTCPRSILAPVPKVPDAATVTNSGIAKANTAYTAWNKGVIAFVACKDKELKAADEEFTAAQASTPALKMMGDYNDVFKAVDEGGAAYKKTGYPAAGIMTALKKDAACPAKPAVTPPPLPTTPLADAKKKEQTAAQKAFSVWLTPLYNYVKCMEPKVNEEINKTNSSVAPFKAKHDAIVADYEEVKAMDTGVNNAWKEFGVAYKARLKSGQ